MMNMYRPGDLLRLRRGLYDHYAVLLSHWRVLEFAGKDPATARPRIVPFDVFANGQLVHVVERSFSSADEIEYRAWHVVLHPQAYDLLWNNCEHIARFVASGVKRSTQVENFKFGVAAVLLGLWLFSD